jgi:formylglycine-generating enzyme required for sulfatase activity
MCPQCRPISPAKTTMALYRKSNGEEVVLASGSCLGVGGEARICVVPSLPGLVAKLYHRPADPYTRKLQAMLANPPTDPTAASGHISIAWPVDLVVEDAPDGRCVGFLMPRVSEMARIIDFFHPRTRRSKSPLFNYLYLHRTARNLAACFHALHEKGYVVGDVNESNILVKETAMVSLVDTDSFQIPDPAGGVLCRCPVGKPDYTPRELHGRAFDQVDRAPEHDVFGLAVLIFQLLMEGTHPFAGVYQGRGEAPSIMARIAAGEFPFAKEWLGNFLPPPSAPEFQFVHPRLRELFLRCFCEGHKDLRLRPSAAEWRDALIEAEEDLVTCHVNEQHKHGSHLAACPWCDRIMRLGGLDPFPSPQAVQHGLHLEPAAAVQTPLPSPTRLASAPPRSGPVPPRSGPGYALPQLDPVPIAAWYESPVRLLQTGSSPGKWRWIVLAGLAASWLWVLGSGSWIQGGCAGVALLLFGLAAARIEAVSSGLGRRRQPLLWCCALSLLLQFGVPAVRGFPVNGLRRCLSAIPLLISRNPRPAVPDRSPFLSSTPEDPSALVSIGPAVDVPTNRPTPAATPPPPNLLHLSRYRLTNSLGMQFVAVPHSNCPVLVSVWETRAQDYEVFLKATGCPPPKQGLPEPTYPAVNVSWNNANDFCQWLTAKERAEGLIKPEDQYRLPTEQEWNVTLTTSDDSYVWGPQWPAPEGVGHCSETRWKSSRSTAPVGSFVANELGLHDLIGNVWEWTSDPAPQRPNGRRLCGGSYRTSLRDERTLNRKNKDGLTDSLAAEKLGPDLGFRVVLETQASREFVDALPRTASLVALPPPGPSQRWLNSLGMRLVPLAGSSVLMAIWETRVRDYDAFAREAGFTPPRPRFEQTPDHPVVNVNWEDAAAFCQWLTRKEQREERIGPGQKYRLPTDLEWSHAIGLGSEEGDTPADRHAQRDRFGYPWNPRKWSVPQGYGNYSRWDSFSFTAPVGSFPPNGLGLYDLSGNVWEWCRDEMTAGRPVLRGSSYAEPFDVGVPDPLLSAHRRSDPRAHRRENNGFRIVLDLNPAQ